MTFPAMSGAGADHLPQLELKLLRTSDPRWVRTMRRGANLILGAVAMSLLGIVVAVVSLGMRREPAMVFVFFLLAAYLMHFVGSWMLTEPEPGLATPSLGASRIIIRGALVFGLMNWVFQIGLGEQRLSQELALLTALVQAGAIFAAIASVFAQLWYVRQLALRIPNRFIAMRALALLWGLVSCVAAIIFLMIFASACSTAAAQSGGTVGLVHVAAMLSAVLMFGVIGCAGVMGIMYLILLARLSGALGAEAKLAEQAVVAVPPI
jgi:hypothetical protein